MQFDILTIFPDLVHYYAEESILGRAQSEGHIEVRAHDFREYSGDKWGRVDDTPYGGGPGMILKIQPLYECLKAIKGFAGKKQKVIVMDPAGKKFGQNRAEQFSKLNRLIIIAGRYEGFDARLYDYVDERISVGEYILAGGELAALTVVEAVSRLIPGVLGNPESLKEETRGKQKEYPQYTRPEVFLEKRVPPVLLSGDHKRIAEWRKKKSV